MIRADSAIADNLARLRDEIAAAAARAGRRPEEITLVGVSKTHSPEAMVAAIHAGLRHIGENRVQEAAQKFPIVRQLLRGSSVLSPQHSALSTQHSALSTQHSALSTQHSVLFHMVGHLQTNKAAAAIGLFDRVDSVDTAKLAESLSRRVPEAAQLPVLIEVYVGDDPSRPGVRPDQLLDVVGCIVEAPRLRVDGLMTIAPLGGDARAAFARVQKLKQTLSEAFPRVNFGVLSMGMSEDYREAIEEGSTEVRIGTALFGPRKPRF